MNIYNDMKKCVEALEKMNPDGKIVIDLEYAKALAAELALANGIVRCKDCRKRLTSKCAGTLWKMYEGDLEWFCADGEKKEGV